MKRLIFLFIVVCSVSCSKNKINLDYNTLSSYSIVTENETKYIADTLNVYLKKSFGIELPVESNIKKNNYIHLKYDSKVKDDFISFNFSENAITILANNNKMLAYGIRGFFREIFWY